MTAKGWPLECVISGAQTGVDQAGLAAAKYLNYRTGGWVPQGCLTEDGPRQDLIDLYNLQPLRTISYSIRTAYNVRNSTGTVLFGEMTHGTALTKVVCEDLRKPFLVNPTAVELRAWIYEHRIVVLNVAGNRESRNPGIYQRTFDLLTTALIPF